jgi:hypothetical protein
LSDWAFQASISDIGLLETDIGFIVIKLVGRTEYEDVKDEVFRLIAGSDYELKMNEYQQMSEYEIGLYRPYQDLYLNYSIAQ